MIITERSALLVLSIIGINKQKQTERASATGIDKNLGQLANYILILSITFSCFLCGCRKPIYLATRQLHLFRGRLVRWMMVLRNSVNCYSDTFRCGVFHRISSKASLRVILPRNIWLNLPHGRSRILFKIIVCLLIMADLQICSHLETFPSTATWLHFTISFMAILPILVIPVSLSISFFQLTNLGWDYRTRTEVISLYSYSLLYPFVFLFLYSFLSAHTLSFN